MEPQSNGNLPPSDGSPTPNLLRRARARKAKDERDAPRVFHLTHTGGDALVRYLSLTDYATIGRLSGPLQARVLAALRMAEGQSAAKPGQRDILKLLQMDDDTSNLYCLIGFLDPQLVESEDALDPDRQDQVLLDDIDPRDRKRFFRVCEGQAEAEAEELLPFFREPAQPVAAGGPGRGDVEPAVGPAGSGNPV